MKIMPADMTSLSTMNKEEIQNSSGMFDKALQAAESVQDKAVGEMSQEEKQTLMKSCREFESLFVFQMLKGMRQAIPQSKFMPHSQGQEIFEGLFDQEMAKQISQSNEGMGLAAMLYEQMTKYQK